MKNTVSKISFPGSRGDMLAARLDLPAGPPAAYVIFAHCFTCSKDLLAMSRVSKALADNGFAVLRFDFTGLGASEGEFANTNFSSNIADLKAAADYLRRNFEAPQILIGHSLGGAAVLAVAADIPEVKAVATIGAPADAEHVIESFQAKLEEIETKGAAEVRLAGRTFSIQKQFLDDLRAQSVQDRIGRLGRALLIFHAPEDDTVGIENAAKIYQAARHPKSFISLDGADHLLSRRRDAEYVASVLSVWAGRYVGTQDGESAAAVAPSEAGDGVLVTESGNGKFQQNVTVGRHRLQADEPVDFGGLDSGPSPYDFLSIALGACTSMTLRLYADRKKLPLDKVQVSVRHEKIHARDCAECAEDREGRVDRFEREIRLMGELDDAASARLLEIADRCPVHRTLEQSSVIATRLMSPDRRSS